jgi:hypothetical protein
LDSCLRKAGTEIFLSTPLLCKFAVPTIAALICILMVMYIPELLREVDDIERYLLKFESSINTEASSSEVDKIPPAKKDSDS